MMNVLDSIRAPRVLPPQVDMLLNQSLIVSLIILFQGSFGGAGVGVVPSVIRNLNQNMLGRVFLLTCIGFAATRNVESALLSAVIFGLVMHLLRTPEERAEQGGIF